METSLEIRVENGKVQCSAAGRQWSYSLDGSESVERLGDETRNSAVKWEGTALLTNTLVSGPRNYVIMERWKLSRDHAVLTISREVDRGGIHVEGRLVYRREGLTAEIIPAGPRTGENKTNAAPAEATFVVPAGTRMLLRLINSVDTKHSHEGDRIYLETAFPVSVNGRVVIPRGAAVTGSVSERKKPGRVAGKAELFVRFESLTLPNGVTRDFRSRLGSAESAAGRVDRQEGKITGEGDRPGDARTVAESAGTGASIGSGVGVAAGQAGKGLGIGAAAGAAAGLAQVLLKRGPDAVLPKGTQVEMVLDRDLKYTTDELGN